MENNNKISFWYLTNLLDDYYDCRENWSYHYRNYEDAIHHYKIITEAYKQRYLNENDELDDDEWDEHVSNDFSIDFRIESIDSFYAYVELKYIEL